MGLQSSFDVLSRVVEQYEAGGRTVRHVEVTETEGGDGLHVEFDVPVSLCAASGDDARPRLTPERASLTDCGGLVVEFSSSGLAALPPETGAAVTASEEAVHVDDGRLLLSVALTIDPNTVDSAATSDDEPRVSGRSKRETASETGGTAADPDGDSKEGSGPDEATGQEADSDEATGQEADSEEGFATVRDETVPPYDDVSYLEALYETCDTFTAMSEAIEMDVSSETVRRYMIEAGVHDPSSYDVVDEPDEEDEQEAIEATTAPATADDPMEVIPDEQLVTDGVGLPEGVHLKDVADAVVDSMTVHEVTRCLGIERQQTTELLKQLNLIDLTMRRVDKHPEEPVSYEQVADRIRESEPSGA